MDEHEHAAQLMLMDLPSTETPQAETEVTSTPKTLVAQSALTASSQGAVNLLGSMATLFVLMPDAAPGIVLVDPRAIAVDPVNVRHLVAFDPDTRGELIESMRALGNTVPVRLRRDPTGGPGFLCPSGSQRLGAALHIQRDDPAFRLRASVAEVMTDKEAFEIAEADNAGRTNVTSMQQARQWAFTLKAVYDGDRRELIAAIGRSASIVSRTLALLTLPDYVYACCSDVEALTPYFAEQLVPRIADPALEPEIRRRAEAMVASGRRLPGAKLIRALLADPTVSVTSSRAVWASDDGTRTVAFRPDRSGGRIDLENMAGLTRDERRTVLRSLDALLRSLPSA